MSVASCLAEGKAIEVLGDRVVVGVPDVSLHRELLDTNDNRRLIEQTMANALGLPRLSVTFRPVAVAVVPPAVAPHPEPYAADIVQAALKLFNAKVVEGRS